jgi:dsRNA-specific ribonuclease
MQYTEQTATRMEATIGYPFSNQLLCVEATQMASPTAAAIFKNQFRGVPNNKRLAILGDAILQKVLCAAWFESDDGQGKEQLSFVSNYLMLQVAYLTRLPGQHFETTY